MHLGAGCCCPRASRSTRRPAIPLAVFHGHFPGTMDGFREQPADPNIKCEYSERFKLDCYNRTQQESATSSTRTGPRPGLPALPGGGDPAREPVLRRLLRGELREPRPLRRRDPRTSSSRRSRSASAASAGLGALPLRRLDGRLGGARGAGRSTRTSGTAALAACPDPIDFRAYMTTDIYSDKNAYWSEGPFGRVARPGHRNYLGHVSATLERLEPRSSWCSARRAARAGSSTSGRRSTRRWEPTAIRSGSGTSARA